MIDENLSEEVCDSKDRRHYSSCICFQILRPMEEKRVSGERRNPWENYRKGRRWKAFPKINFPGLERTEDCVS